MRESPATRYGSIAFLPQAEHSSSNTFIALLIAFVMADLQVGIFA
jgi:hypothetical protein